MSHHITIIGAGFGALSSVRELRQRDANAEITVISPRAELHYLPGTIWIPSGLRNRAQLTIDLQNFFARMRVKHVQAEVTGLREGGRVVSTSAGEVRNDALIIASALEVGCTTLLSEDMQDGRTIRRPLTITNPFAGA